MILRCLGLIPFFFVPFEIRSLRSRWKSHGELLEERLTSYSSSDYDGNGADSDGDGDGHGGGGGGGSDGDGDGGG
ncbi:hypothetical protein HZH68_007946 [Vespula germanica]|uniref:Uncharacterized protein n=1 Tax=Vespula germanica TaxID=30212 RepID=A0A834K2U6_VESGE|nr:hypothetical protein HZH68_007946 [Vespula germanica]